jgi:predicted enzyme related to lactoylglutathione lyase
VTNRSPGGRRHFLFAGEPSRIGVSHEITMNSSVLTPAATIRVKEIAFVLHPVADIARARKFYEQLLGLAIGMQLEFTPGVWWIEYEIAGVALAVTNLFPAGAPGGASLSLEVADLDAARAAIAGAKSTVTSDITEYPPCRMFGIMSPDGHSVIFHQRKAA